MNSSGAGLIQVLEEKAQAGLVRRYLSLLVFALCGTVFPLLVMGPWGPSLEAPTPRLLVFSILVLIGAAMLKTAWPQVNTGQLLLAAPLFYAALYKLAGFIPDVSAFPFSLGWSETSRYYYASLFFSEKVYGMRVPPSVLHPSRYLMQSVPFLITDAPLWLHRLWQVLLWIVASLGTALILRQRLTISERFHRWLFVLWAFLFLFQGPVYYHLLVMPALVLWGYDHKRPWRTWIVVLLASAWAGISRINWVPVPGMLAASLYFLELSKGDRPFWRYLLRPLAWVGAGSMVALAAQKAYELSSGNPSEHFGTSFTSDLLWYRLLPSSTYPLGVLPAAALVSLPAVLMILFCLWPHWKDYHPLRLLGLGSILSVLFAGGVLVSAKIGGGSNLHNLDAYLVLLLVVAAYIFFGPFPADKPSSSSSLPGKWAPAALAVVIPIVFAVASGGPLAQRDLRQAEAALQTLKEEVASVVDAGGEILFISQRHLLSFKMLDDVRLYPDYEKVFLMEMAMSGNRPYLNTFEQELSSHRFTLIVSEPLSLQYQGRAYEFGEENDAWVRGVVEPLLRYYEPRLDLPAAALQLLLPRSGSQE